MLNLNISSPNGSAGSDINSMKDVLAKYETSFPRLGEILNGEVISAARGGVLVNLGTLGTGIVYPLEFYDNPHSQKNLKAGDKVAVVLLDLENESGYRELSLKKAQMTTAWEDIQEKKNKGEIISTSILNINKGGLIVEINGIQGFLPLSQLSAEHYPKVEGGDTTKIVQALQKFRGQNFNVKILDFSEKENKLIVSERAILSDQIQKELEKFKVGETVTGIITDVTDFGGFVKISENIEGLVHISEIDWKIVENTRDYLTVGKEITAKIINIDNGRVSLSLKALKPDPWEKIEEKFSVGQILEGEIARLTAYGILVKVSEGVMGLVPQSEINSRKELKIAIGEKLKVAIVNIDPREHKMFLTLQQSEGKNEEKPEA